MGAGAGVGVFHVMKLSLVQSVNEGAQSYFDKIGIRDFTVTWTRALAVRDLTCFDQ